MREPTKTLMAHVKERDLVAVRQWLRRIMVDEEIPESVADLATQLYEWSKKQ